MHNRFAVGSAFLLAALTCAAASAVASDPVGIYALIDRVVLEPGVEAPTRIQVWGTFALTDGQRGDGYLSPQRGYLYFTLNPAKERVCRKEWKDLQTLAGKNEGIGFGHRYQASVRIRNAGEKPGSPDEYPTGVGIVRMGSIHNQPRILKELRESARAQ